MSILVTDCPRCGVDRMTFDVSGQNYAYERGGWQHIWEMFCVCRDCRKATIFVVGVRADYAAKVESVGGPANMDGSISKFVEVRGFINIRHLSAQVSPKHLPPEIEAVFNEGLPA